MVKVDFLKKICVVGKTPPPIGGVTVYVKRRIHQLSNEGKDVDFVSFESFFSLIRMIFKRYNYIEVNSINLIVVFFFYATFKIKYCNFIDHNASRHYSGIKKRIFNYLISKSNRVLLVNDDLRVNYSKNVNLDVVCPFIPPDLDDEAAIVATYPDDVRELLVKGGFFVNSAWKYIKHQNTDLYGISESLRLLEVFDNSILLLAVAEFSIDSFPHDLQTLIGRLVKEKRLFLLVGQKELWPVFKNAVLSLRLTPVDGDSVSVREALFFNCNVLASNSVCRPTDCHIYEYGNFDDLIFKFQGLYK